MSSLKLLTPEEVGDLLGVTEHTLANWRCERRHNLPYVKVGRLVRYREEDVDAYIEQQTQADSSDDFDDAFGEDSDFD